MVIQEVITLDMLTIDSVSILKQNLVEINGELVQVGENWRRALQNSESGRNELSKYLGEPYLTTVMTLWGDKPTVEETPMVEGL